MTRGDMPPEPDGTQTVSNEVFDHMAVEAFKNADLAFAVCVDHAKGMVWIARRGCTPDPDRVTDRSLFLALHAAVAALEYTGGTEGGGSFIAPGDGG